MAKELEVSSKLLRHLLSSIDLLDIEEIKNLRLNDIEIRARAGDVEIFYRNHFKKILKLLIQKQLEFIASEATSELQLQFARGTINGFTLLDDWCKEQTTLSLSRFKGEEEEPEPGEAITPM